MANKVVVTRDHFDTLVNEHLATAGADLQGDVVVSGNMDIRGSNITNTLTGGLNLSTSGANTTVKGGLVVDENSQVKGDLTLDQDLKVEGGNITSSTATNAANVFNTTTGTTTLGGGAVNISAVGSATVIKGDLTVDGSLNFKGDTTLIATQNLNISDNLIGLNKDLASNVAPSNDSGILINRGNQPNAFMGWDEDQDNFKLGTTNADASSTGDLAITTKSLVAHLKGDVSGNVTGNLVGNVTGDVTGNADTATKLASTVNIGGVPFDGSTAIDLSGVTVEGNQNTTGNAGTATKLASTVNIGNVSFDGSTDIIPQKIDVEQKGNVNGTYHVILAPDASGGMRPQTNDLKYKITNGTTKVLVSNLEGTADNSKKVVNTLATNDNNIRYLLFADSDTTTVNGQDVKTSSNVKVSSNGKITAVEFDGSFNGNATSATSANSAALLTGDQATKLDGIEAGADVTDVSNVAAAGALMDSELADLDGIKAVTISTLQVKPTEGAFVDGDKTKLDSITVIAGGATVGGTVDDASMNTASIDGTDHNVRAFSSNEVGNYIISLSATADASGGYAIRLPPNANQGSVFNLYGVGTQSYKLTGKDGVTLINGIAISNGDKKITVPPSAVVVCVKSTSTIGNGGGGGGEGYDVFVNGVRETPV